MCRHEAAEALAALSDVGSLELLRACRDDEGEEVVVRETCEIAVDRIEWERDEEGRRKEKLKQRYVGIVYSLRGLNWKADSILPVTFHR